MAIDIGIDLGSANTLICLKDKGIILSSPTFISIDQNTNKDLCRYLYILIRLFHCIVSYHNQRTPHHQ